MSDRYFIDATDILIAEHIREARQLQIIQGNDFAEFVADREGLISNARKQFLNIADPKAKRGIEEKA